MTDSTLIEMLKTAREYAYAPYSGHAVGAVAESPDGRRFAAANVETAHYKSLCAEAVAIAAMIGAGYRRLGRVYIMGPGSDPCTPCGDSWRDRHHQHGQRRTRALPAATAASASTNSPRPGPRFTSLTPTAMRWLHIPSINCSPTPTAPKFAEDAGPRLRSRDC